MIIDDLVPKQTQNEIERFLIGNTYFPYYHCLDTVESYEEQTLFSDPLVLHQPQFVHILNIEGETRSSAYNEILKKFNFTSLLPNHKISRAKINLLPPAINASPHHYHVPHFDSKNSKDITVIYYVNDSDGDTVIFKESYKESIPEKLSIERTISPKKGRILIFNSNQFHASRPPIKMDFRCIINMVFTSNNQ